MGEVQSYKWKKLGIMKPDQKAIKLGIKALSQMSNPEDNPTFFLRSSFCSYYVVVSWCSVLILRADNLMAEEKDKLNKAE